jgi:sterol desaturase/sphingolipid hydroxylase (fatty acid hydroxylase superfamily)
MVSTCSGLAPFGFLPEPSAPAMAVILWVAKLLFLFLAWTGASYGIHRLAHIGHRWNLLFRIHMVHHSPDYLRRDGRFRWRYLLMCFDSIPESLDVFITLTLPLLVLAWIFPSQGVALLIFHYLYEITLSDELFDHNPSIAGSVTRWLACGQYHLEHHRRPSRHFGLIITFWDRVFASSDGEWVIPPS